MTRIEQTPYFGTGEPSPPDPILKLQAEFERDPRPNKLNLGIGYYCTSDGHLFIPRAILEAASRVFPGMTEEQVVNVIQGQNLPPKDTIFRYLAPTTDGEWLGDPRFIEGSTRLIFGPYAQDLLEKRRIAVSGTDGGTGANSLAAEALQRRHFDLTVLLSGPTWPNHINIFQSLGFKIMTYPHLYNHAYDLEAHLEAIKKSPPETVVLFHTGQAHNPTGDNPKTDEEWRLLAQAMEGRRAFFDTAYAGLANGLEEDTRCIRIFMEEEVPVGVAMSYSKNGGLYGLRVGLLMVPASTSEEALDQQRLLNSVARVHYSSPSSPGEWIIGEVYSDEQLFSNWGQQLAKAADDLRSRRQRLVEKLGSGFDFIGKQAGLFSLLGFTKDQAEQIQTEQAVYMFGDRPNFGMLFPQHVEQFAEAVLAVL